MTEAIKPSSQDDPYPDEDLLEGLHKLVPQTYYQAEVPKDVETDGSMLLHSINEYLHPTQTVIETIQENVQEEQEAFPTLQKPPPIINEEISLPAIGDADDQISRNSAVFSPKGSPKPVQQAINNEEPKLPNLERTEAGFLLGFSHYNDKQEQSLAKTDLNSSLLVQVSNQKSIEFNRQDPYNCPSVPQDHSFFANIDGSAIAQQHTVPSIDHNKEQKESQTTLKQNSPIKERAAEEDKHGEAISNYSMDSSKLVEMIPVEYLVEQRSAIQERIEQADNQYHKSPSFQQNEKQTINFIQAEQLASELLNIPMEIQSTYTKPLDIPMDIQDTTFRPLDVPADIEATFSKPLNMLMEIEQAVFPCFSNSNNQELNAITLDPIQQDTIQQLGEQQRQEQQEMLDSISGQRAIPIQMDHYKEFTFGKENNENSVDEYLREETFKNMEKNMSFQVENANNTDCNQIANDSQIHPNQSQSFWNALRQENIQNLSMNVQHDNNFSTAMREVDEMINNAFKNETSQALVNNNEAILANVLEECVLEIDSKQISISRSKIPYEEPQPEKQAKIIEEKEPIVGTEIVQVIEQDRMFKTEQRQRVIESILNRNQCIDAQIIENNRQNCDNQQTYAEKQHLQQDRLPPVHNQPDFTTAKPSNLKQPASKNFTIRNQVSNFNFGSEQGHFPHHHQCRCQQYQHSCHHQCYEPRYQPNFNNFMLPPQNQAVLNNQVLPQQLQQPVIQMQPWLTINYKMNQASISLFGPVFSPPKEDIAANVKKTSKDKKVDHPSKREQVSLPECLIEQITLQVQQPSVTQICDRYEVKAKERENTKQAIQVKQTQKPVQKQFTTTSIQTAEVNLSKQQLEQQVVQVIEDPYEKYEFLIKQSEDYLLSFENKAENAHKQFQKLISPYVLLKFTPEPKNQIGAQIFKNGLFLIALVKLASRSSPNPFIFYYMYEYLESAFGHSLERNSYFFKNECLKAKNNYESVLEKKYGEMLFSRIEQKQQAKKNEAIKRNCITPNPFFSIHPTKQDEGFQVGSQKLTTPRKIEVVVKEDKSPLKDKNNQKEKSQQQRKVPQQEKIAQTVLIEAPQPSKRQIRIDETKIQIVPVQPVIPIVSITQPLPKKTPPTVPTTQPPSKNIQKSQIIETPVCRQTSANQQQKEQKTIQIRDFGGKPNKDTNAGQKIKKNLQEIKNSFTYSGKSEKNPDSNEVSRYKDLYDKYRKIQEEKKNNKSDLPIENESIKRDLVNQMLKSDQEEKKVLKKQVGFPEDVIRKDISDTNKEEVEKSKKDKKKKAKSKRDNSSEPSDQEDGAAQIKTRRTFSKKDK